MTAIADAQRLQDDYQRQLNRIRTNTRLSDAAKRADVARLTLDTRRQMAELKAKHDRDIATRRENLQRRAFTVTPDPDPQVQVAREASYRDALDRAERAANRDEARALLDRAALTWDDTMARAVAVIAVQRGWGDLIERYADAFPTDGKAVAELFAFEQQTGDIRTQFAEGAQFYLAEPETSGLSDRQLEATAEGAA